MKGTPIYSTADGTVILAGRKTGYGNVIVVQHSNLYRTVYAHLSKILVIKGESLTKGQMIAKMGSTGRSTDNHLHYEVHFRKKPVNPIKFLSSYLK
jgi:murein DD-endopeptidase MepM/ murein hydrolase activator NlpD